jgi:hypothetical protein
MDKHGELSESEAPVISDVTHNTEPLPMRPKLDVEAMRKDMNSFREVSVKSTQKALESHAMRKEQSGLAGRQAVVIALVVVTLFVVVAEFMEIIDFPLIVWGLVLGSAASGIELYRCRRAVREKVKELTRVTGPHEDGGQEVDNELADPTASMPEKLNNTVVPATMPETDAPAASVPVSESYVVDAIEPETASNEISEAADLEADPASQSSEDASKVAVVAAADQEEEYYEL